MIELVGVSKSYQLDENGLPVLVLRDINLSLAKKEFTAVMGPSGSGKSSLINIISFLDKDFTGKYTFLEQNVKDFTDKELSILRNCNVGFVFQSFNLIDNNTVYENVELPLLYKGLSHKKAKPIVMEQLSKVGLVDKKNRFPYQLSGGQKQRIAIARALVNNPSFIVADEPTGALDSKTSNEIMSLFQELNARHEVTILMVTHDKESAQFCSRIIEVRDGNVIG